MKPPGNEKTATTVRQATEARLQAKPAPQRRLSETELQKLQHELEGHQLELEMQNQELQAARAELEGSVARYTELYDFAPVGYCNLSAEGEIHQINLAEAKLLGGERAQLVGLRIIPTPSP